MEDTQPRKHIPFRFEETKNPFVVPAGQYRAIVSSVNSAEAKGDPTKRAIKFTFKLVEGKPGPVDYLATKVYVEGSPSYAVLSADIEAFFAPDEIEEIKRTNTALNLADLEGMEVDLTIKTIASPKFQQPYSKVDGIFPSGYLFPPKRAAAPSSEDFAPV
jgi:hypothetical protein